MLKTDEFDLKVAEYISKNNIDTKNVAIVREYNQFEVKSLNQADSPAAVRIKGYLSTFKNVDRQNDVVDHGAFDATIKGLKKLPMLRDHSNRVDCQIGSWDTFKIDDTGLYVEGLIERTKETEHLIALISGGHLDTLSMGGLFRYSDKPNKSGNNVITAVTVLEGSVVAIPANDKATFTAKSFSNTTSVATAAKRSKLEMMIASEQMPVTYKEVCRQLLEEMGN